MLTNKKNWVRHTAMVPKGFIRFHVLEALNERSMSGSEIIFQIEKYSAGLWKPSPGSIYPLLSWLQRHNYVKVLPFEDGLKRYELTSSGKLLLQEQKNIRQKLKEYGFLQSYFFDTFLINVSTKKSMEIRNSMKRLGLALLNLGAALKENYSEEAINESLIVLNNSSQKIEKINEKLKVDTV